jgi:hypothetical protein
MTHALMVAGEPVNKIYAIYLNSNYVQPENGTDISSLIVIEELSSKVKKLIHKVKSNLSEAMEFALKSAEELNPEEHKCNRKDCPALDFLNIKSAENELESVPSVQYDNSPIVKNEALQTWLQKLQYPIYFLDYEALTANIPVYPNTKPFQHVVFQYSLHLILSPEAKPIHFEFLPDDKSNPTEKLLQSLCNNINNDNGSVLVWHDSFEKTRNREMASFFPEFSEKLLDINRRIIDLEKVFNQDGGLYIHPNFDGKSSLKKVFPVLLPSESSYEELEIGDGMMASILWHRYLCNSISEDYPEEKLRSDLLQYCGLDTGAMVKILEFLLAHF